MEAIILTWNKEESNPLQVKPGEENSPGFLFFGNAPRKEKLKENAEVNTLQILVVYNTDTNTINAYWSFSTSYSIGHLSDIYRTFIGHSFRITVCATCLMYCVTALARIADGTSSSLVSASLQPFMAFHKFLVVSAVSLLATLFLCVPVKLVLQLSSL